ncbi:CRISPR-associated endonuclease Cas2 [Kitasatospora sp. NPDC006697]|uniref:CRISPR-associated endonuclease Cas2 n=1 Tax=Kitasatospora sp. NPDC006697 TaxID=3364020 RepID=UPI003677CDC3
MVVYDTAAQRNPKILRTCRKYLHHVQRSVFEGQLSQAQLRHFRAAVEDVLDLTHDNLLIYTMPYGAEPQRIEVGVTEPAPSDIL